MKRLIVAAVMAAAAFTAQAEQTTTITLTKEQAAQLMKSQGSAPVETAKTVSAAVREEASAWGEMGANMGRALVAASREVGVAANEFATTPLGRLTVAIVAYKLIGEDILGVLVGSSMLLVILAFDIYLLRSRTLFAEKVEYTHTPVLWGAFNRRVVVRVDIEEGAWVARTILGLLVTVAGTITAVKLIFF